MELLERSADDAVQLPTARLDQTAVCDLLDEPMAEAVLRRRSAALLDDEVEPLQLGERRSELRLRDELLEQRHPERSADDGRDVDHLPRLRLESVEPRLERLLDERRD